MPYTPEYTFFDLDHTLIEMDCEQAWVDELIQIDIFAEGDRAAQAEFIEMHALGKTPAEEYIAFMMRAFKGKSEAEMAVIAASSFAHRIRSTIFPEAIRELARVKKAGSKIVILSGSFHPIVAPIAEYLAVTRVVCSELEVRGGVFTGNLASAFCVREGKVDRAREFVKAKATTLDDIAFYGDSLSDLPMFELAGQVNVVNPRPALAKLAASHGWRVLRWSGSKVAT